MTQGQLVFAAITLLFPGLLAAETCTTQSHLAPADRTAIAQSAQAIAVAVQSNNPATLRTESTPDIQKNFGELQYMVAVTSPKLAGGSPQVEQIYVLDASANKPNADGTFPEAQFFCSLNNSASEADFDIPALPPSKYAFAMVAVPSRPVPWRLSMLLLNQGNQWLLAGFYPKPQALGGHDGLWYWTQARTYAAQKQLWDAWLFYQEAMDLLRPADFVLSTHLDKLHTEQTGATPPALSGGISPQTPLVLRAPGSPPAGSSPPPAPAPASKAPVAVAAPSADFHFIGLNLVEPAAGSGPVLHAELEAEPLSDPAAGRDRNLAAARVLLQNYPELRKPFTEVTITTTSAGQPPLTTDMQMSDIH